MWTHSTWVVYPSRHARLSSSSLESKHSILRGGPVLVPDLRFFFPAAYSTPQIYLPRMERPPLGRRAPPISQHVVRHPARVSELHAWSLEPYGDTRAPVLPSTRTEPLNDAVPSLYSITLT
jgi:hypothetical protein